MSNQQPTKPDGPNLQEIETFLTTGDRAALQSRQRAGLRKSALDAITKGTPIKTPWLDSGGSNPEIESDKARFIRMVRAEAYRYRNPKTVMFNPNKTYLP